MAIYSLETFKTRVRPSSRLLSLDIGRKTIGLAISNSELTLASQLETLERQKLKLMLPKLKSIIAQRNVGGLVIGFPLNFDGSRSVNCDRVEGFAQSLIDIEDELIKDTPNTELVITFYDERFSTKTSEALLIEADISRKKRKKVVDQMAATVFLKSALDALALLD